MFAGHNNVHRISLHRARYRVFASERISCNSNVRAYDILSRSVTQSVGNQNTTKFRALPTKPVKTIYSDAALIALRVHLSVFNQYVQNARVPASNALTLEFEHQTNLD